MKCLLRRFGVALRSPTGLGTIAYAVVFCSALLLSACGGGNSKPTPAMYSIEGIVSGLYAGAQVTLRNNGSDPITVTTNGSFSFATPVSSNGTYAVTVATQPLAQVCTVAAGTGSGVTSTVSSVRIACSPATESVLHAFNVNRDAEHPSGNAIQGSDGNFYGTGGGGTNDFGTVYKITPAGVETVLYSFSGGPGDAAASGSALVQGTDGDFYGTGGGGAKGFGTVFKITPAGVETVLYSFSGNTTSYTLGGTTDGGAPSGALVQGSDGNFYGTTQSGGTNNFGTVYKITPAGVETVLYSFSGPPTDGFGPTAALVQGTDGNFYGTTPSGGTTGNGTVFKITPLGAETVIHSFAGAPADGSQPLAALIQGSDGNFYGTTPYGGASDSGSLIKITPAGTETLVYSFNSGREGQYPVGLILGNDGNLYGTTADGGTAGGGTVFKMTPSGVETVLYSFHGGSDGNGPFAALVQGSDGNFYGTTESGGTTSNGTVFKVTPSGVETVLYAFRGASDGSGPDTALVQGSDGNFYGTTAHGGAVGYGTVFKVTPSGVESVLHSFAGNKSDGSYASGALVQGSDGNFYGTTMSGGADDAGTVYKITPAGVETVLYSFNIASGLSGPAGALIEGSDGNFYGTTAPGIGQGGAVFKITPGGVVTVLYVFQSGANKIYPSGPLIKGSDGNFYGTAQWWDGSDASLPQNGAVFMVTPTGVETTLHTFTGGADGSLPNSLIQGSGGNFYGTTYEGGASNQGTVFTF